MILFALIVTWFVCGLIDFRYTGHAAIEHANAVNKHRAKLRTRASSEHGHACNKNPRYPSLSSSPDFRCNCHLAYDTSPVLAWVFIYTQLLWPIIVGAWAVTNGSRWISRKLELEGLNFFAPAGRVKTTKEILAERDARMKELESNIANMEKELLK